MRFALLLLLTGLSFSAAAKPSQILIQVDASGERSFSILTTCNQIQGVALADAHTEIVTGQLAGGAKVDLKLAIKPPSLVDAEHRGKKICSARCPSGFAPLPISSEQGRKYVLACSALSN